MTSSLAAIHAATRDLVRRVDGLDDASFTDPSTLPGWSRGHVVAHVALNAEGLARVLQSLAVGEDVPMYDSVEARNDDIASLAGAAPSVIRDRFLASTTVFQAAAEHVPDDAWRSTFQRIPGADPLPAADILGMRHREVVIHHTDLDAGFTVADWPEDFLDAMFNQLVRDRAGGSSMRLRTPDGEVLLGDGSGPIVSGSRADLTWWLLGRGEGTGLQADPALPTLGPWR